MKAYEETLECTRAYLDGGTAILEVGCGTGSTALTLAGDVGHITAVDVSANMLAIARERAAEQNADNVQFLQGDLTTLDTCIAGFDVVLAFNVLHLIADPAAALAHLSRRLRPGGTLISKTPCLSPRAWHLRTLIAAMRALGYAPAVTFMTARDLERAMADAELNVIDSREFSGAPRIRFVVAQKGIQRD